VWVIVDLNIADVDRPPCKTATTLPVVFFVIAPALRWRHLFDRRLGALFTQVDQSGEGWCLALAGSTCAGTVTAETRCLVFTSHWASGPPGTPAWRRFRPNSFRPDEFPQA